MTKLFHLYSLHSLVMAVNIDYRLQSWENTAYPSQKRFTKSTQSNLAKPSCCFFDYLSSVALQWWSCLLPVFRHLGVAQLPNPFCFKPLAATISRCWVFCWLSLPVSLGRKYPKEIAISLEMNVLMALWNAQREQTMIPLKTEVFPDELTLRHL